MQKVKSNFLTILTNPCLSLRITSDGNPARHSRFLWFVAGDKRLPASIRNKIEDINFPCFLSSASLWEITIKFQIGKLILSISLEDLFDYVERNQIEIIPISYDHLLTLSTLPNHHSDPFDRLIISQAISEDLVLISQDKELKKYSAKVQWN